MKKKLTFLLAGVIALSGFAVGAVSKNIVEKIEAELRGDFTVYVDGKKQTFRDVAGNIVDPILYEGTTYLPVRAIGELMGKTVYWYQDEKKIELVEPAADEPLVTDADVIIDGTDKVKEERVEKIEKPTVAAVEVKITLEEAKAIALEKAGLKESDVVFEEAKLDREHGRVVYDIEFRQGRVEYCFEINAADGAIVEWEKDHD